MTTQTTQDALPITTDSPTLKEKLIVEKNLSPDQFFDLCLREQLKQIRFLDFGPGDSNALWTVRYYQKEQEPEQSE